MTAEDMCAPTTDQPISIFDKGGKTGWLYSYYLQDEWKLFPTLTLNFGARFDQMDQFTKANQLSPRANLVWQPTDTTTFTVGYARYFVPPPFELVNSSSIGLFANTTAAPAITLDSTPKPERDHYFDVGASQVILPGLKAGVDAYYKIASNLIDEGQFGAPIILTPFNYQKGLLKGIEVLLSYDVDNWSFYGNFAASQNLAKNITSAQFNFDPDELDRLLAEPETEEELTDPDIAPPPPRVPVTVAGDLWILGDHRLLCGDATDKGARPQVRVRGLVKEVNHAGRGARAGHRAGHGGREGNRLAHHGRRGRPRDRGAGASRTDVVGQRRRRAAGREAAIAAVVDGDGMRAGVQRHEPLALELRRSDRSGAGQPVARAGQDEPGLAAEAHPAQLG